MQRRAREICAGFFATLRHAPKMNLDEVVDHGTGVSEQCR